MKEDSFQELPINFVVHLLEIKFDCHKAWFGFASLEAMLNFLDNNLVLCYPPIWYEGRLGRRYQFIKKRPKLFHQKL